MIAALMASFHFIKLVQVIFFTIVCLVTQSCRTLCNLVCVCVCVQFFKSLLHSPASPAATCHLACCYFFTKGSENHVIWLLPEKWICCKIIFFFFFLPFTLSWLRETVRVAEGAIIFLWHLSVTEKPDSFPGGSVGKESACSAGDPSSIPGLGRSAGEGIGYPLQYSWASLVAQLVKNPPAVWDTWVRPLGWEDPLEKGKLPAPVFWPGEFHGLYTWSFSATRFSSQEPLPDASDSWSRCVQQQSHLHWEN